MTAYQWVPFITSRQYLSVTPYLQEYKFDSFGAPAILGWLFTGDLFDHGRLPVLTLLLALGIGVAVVRRTRLNVFVLTGFLVWLVLYFGRPTLGPLFDLFPLSDGLLIHRFIGEMELFAVPLMGLGGEALIWRLTTRFFARFAQGRSPRTALGVPLVAGLVIVLLLVPAFEERYRYYTFNTAWIERAHNGLAADTDLQAIVSAIKAQPYGGRSYAGLRTNYGKDMTVGTDLKVSDILAFYDVPAVSPPYQSLSLNADMIWWFQDGDPSDFDVMDVRYAIVPAGFTVPDFYAEIYRTTRYVLYRIGTSGVAQYVEIASRQAVASQRSLFDANLAWFRSADPAARRFIRWDYLEPLGPLDLRAPCPSGRTLFERDEFDAMHLVVECPTDGALALKVTYHPNWRVTIDGQQASTYMVSPSYIGVDVPAGRHVIEAIYESTPVKIPLLVIGMLTLVGVATLRRRLDAIPQRLALVRPWWGRLRSGRAHARPREHPQNPEAACPNRSLSYRASPLQARSSGRRHRRAARLVHPLAPRPRCAWRNGRYQASLPLVSCSQ